MKVLKLRLRSLVMNAVLEVDNILHKIKAPGSWWCDFAEEVVWWAMAPEISKG